MCHNNRDGYFLCRRTVTSDERLSLALALRLPLAALAALAAADGVRRAHGDEPHQATSEPGGSAATDDGHHHRRARQHPGEADSARAGRPRASARRLRPRWAVARVAA